jgi:hypothetical protein
MSHNENSPFKFELKAFCSFHSAADGNQEDFYGDQDQDLSDFVPGDDTMYNTDGGGNVGFGDGFEADCFDVGGSSARRSLELDAEEGGVDTEPYDGSNGSNKDQSTRSEEVDDDATGGGGSGVQCLNTTLAELLCSPTYSASEVEQLPEATEEPPELPNDEYEQVSMCALSLSRVVATLVFCGASKKENPCTLSRTCDNCNGFPCFIFDTLLLLLLLLLLQVDNLGQDTVVDGRPYYLVDSKWWRLWKHFKSNYGLSGGRPVAIDNTQLLEERKASSKVATAAAVARGGGTAAAAATAAADTAADTALFGGEGENASSSSSSGAESCGSSAVVVNGGTTGGGGLEPQSSSSSSSNVFALRKKVCEFTDFFAVNEEQWKLLVGWYGGGPAVVRFGFKESKTSSSIPAVYDIHGVNMVVKRSSSSSSTEGGAAAKDGESSSSSSSSLLGPMPLPVNVRKCATPRQLCAALARHWGIIGSQGVQSVRLWDHYNGER